MGAAVSRSVTMATFSGVWLPISVYVLKDKIKSIYVREVMG